MSEKIHDGPPQGKRNQTFTGDKLDWMRANRLTEPSYFKVGFFIIDHISERWREGFPSQETIAEITGMSVKTVRRATKFFEKLGWLTVKRERTYDHKARKWKTHNTYSLCMDNVQPALDEIADIRRKRRIKRDTGVRSENVLRPAFKGDTGDPLTRSNIPLEERREA